MPKYKKKITSLMDYQEFKQAIQSSIYSNRDRCFLTLLFFAGCRVSEALALKPNDVRCTKDTIYVQFRRLKGSKQTDPQELPMAIELKWLCWSEASQPLKGNPQEGELFPFSRNAAYRLVKRAFPDLYPHYFRMNRITKTDILFGDATVYHIFGITASSIDHYRGKVDIKRVGKALNEELI